MEDASAMDVAVGAATARARDPAIKSLTIKYDTVIAADLLSEQLPQKLILTLELMVYKLPPQELR